MTDTPTAHEATVYDIDADDHIVDVNGEWLAFARANGAARLEAEQVLGHSLWDYVRGQRVRDLYRLLLDRLRLGGGKVSFPYRCDSPEFRRFMLLHMEALDEGRVRFRSRVVREERRGRPSVWDGAVDRLDPLQVCSLCLRMRTGVEQWEELSRAIIEFDLFGPAQEDEAGESSAEGQGGSLEFTVCDECSDLVAGQCGAPSTENRRPESGERRASVATGR